ncbi:hypothetical protein OROHE_004363 [Orobanche hederae]
MPSSTSNLPLNQHNSLTLLFAPVNLNLKPLSLLISIPLSLSLGTTYPNYSDLVHLSMEDNDNIQSRCSPTPNGRISVTVAAPSPPPPSKSLALALPIQNHQRTPSSGGVREDCWSEGATAVLIDAWGERYLELSRGNLKQKHWKDVADIVSSREDYPKTHKTDVQCKNRIDTVKKKYKVEKTRIASGGGPSKWRFFDKLDELIGLTAKINSTPTSVDANTTTNNNNSNNYKYQQKVHVGIPVGVRSSCAEPQDRFQNNKPSRKRPPVDSSDDDDDDDDDDDNDESENSLDSSDGLPPEANKRRRSQREPRMVNNANPVRKGMMMMMNKKSGGGNKESDRGNSSSMRELSRVIWKFGEAYEQAETAKLQQLVEMEKQRMKFAKDLELHRMQYFMKIQLELSQLKNRRTGSETNNNNHHNGISTNHNDDDDDDNNSST